MKGSLALDFIGKWVLILLAVAVAVGLIVTFSGSVRHAIGDLMGGHEKKPVYVRVNLKTHEDEVAKVSELIGLCYKDKLNSNKDDTCFIVVNENGPFSITSSDINNSLYGGLKEKVVFKSNNYNRETIVISYAWADEKVIVDQ